jgi:hypothetical protein
MISQPMLNNIIKLLLIVLLLVCLFDMPYGYFQLVRFIAFLSFGFFAYNSYQENNNLFASIYASLAILFQPLMKIALGREIWNIVDVIVALFLIVSIFLKNKSTKIS